MKRNINLALYHAMCNKFMEKINASDKNDGRFQIEMKDDNAVFILIPVSKTDTKPNSMDEIESIQIFGANGRNDKALANIIRKSCMDVLSLATALHDYADLKQAWRTLRYTKREKNITLDRLYAYLDEQDDNQREARFQMLVGKYVVLIDGLKNKNKVRYLTEQNNEWTEDITDARSFPTAEDANHLAKKLKYNNPRILPVKADTVH